MVTLTRPSTTSYVNCLSCYVTYKPEDDQNIAETCSHIMSVIEGDSVARCPKQLSIKNYVSEIMTCKFIYIYREICKTGPAQSMLKLVSFHIQAHLNAFLQILEYFSQTDEVDGLNLLAHSVFELFD